LNLPPLKISLIVEGLILIPNKIKPYPTFRLSVSTICFTREARNLEAINLNLSERKLKSVTILILGKSVYASVLPSSWSCG